MRDNNNTFNQHSVYRLVNKRLGLALLLIMTVVGFGSYFLEQHRLLNNIQDIALKRANQFIRQFDDQLSNQRAVDSGAIQQSFDTLTYKKIEFSEGIIVSSVVLDNRGKTVVRYYRNTDSVSEAVKTLMKQSTERENLKQLNINSKLIQVGDKQYVLIQFPIQNDTGMTLGQAIILFLPSTEKLNAIQAKARNSTLAAIAIVLITAFLIYPIIIRLVQQLSAVSMDLLKANLQTAKALGSAIAKRDSDTDAHNYRVTIYSVRLAEAINLDTKKMQGLIKGAFLHDVGKIGTSDQLLLKPGKLTDTEFVEMKKHVGIGVDIIKNSSWLEDAEDVVLHHHEKYNGGGYSAQGHDTLSGHHIPLVARIFTIADVFDALTSSRPYKDPVDFDTTMAEMEKNVGTHFDPELFNTFKSIARPLYDSLAHREDEHLHNKLTEIVRVYFLDDLEQLLS